MIFITVGTQKFQFNRLLELVDHAVVRGDIRQDVFAQTGYSDYQPEHYPSVDFLSKENYEKQIQDCELLITHSGVGSIITGLKCHKPVIVVPRLAQYNEHVDNHQLEIAESFGEKNLVLVYQPGDDIQLLVEKAKTHKFNSYVSRREQVIATIENYIETFSDHERG